MHFNRRFAELGVLHHIPVARGERSSIERVSRIQYENRNQGWVIDSSGGPGVATADRRTAVTSSRPTAWLCPVWNAYAQASLRLASSRRAFFTHAYHQPDVEISRSHGEREARLQEDLVHDACRLTGCFSR